MYYYHFTHYAGNDRVFRSEKIFGEPGDLLSVGGEYMLVLGEEVARKEQHTKPWKSTEEPKLISAWLLSEKSLAMIHRMVEYRFTTYKNVLPLRIGDIDDLIKYKPSRESAPQKRKKKSAEQQLIIFPDLRTMHAYIAEHKNDLPEVFLTLHSQTSAKQKAQAFRSLKFWKATTVLCTYSQLFQDRAHLTSITLIDQHKWYYKSQQDPRYYVPTVAQQLAKTSGATLEKTWFQLA